MTVAAALALAFLLFAAFRRAARLRHARAVVHRVACERGAEQGLARADGLGLVNPAPPRRWSSDRKADDPAPLFAPWVDANS